MIRTNPICELESTGDLYRCSFCQWESRKPSVRRNCPRQKKIKGVGGHHAELFAAMGFLPVAGCQCNSIRHRMTQLGPDGCEREMASLVGEIQQEAIRRRWPLMSSRLAGWSIESIIRQAIKRARAE